MPRHLLAAAILLIAPLSPAQTHPTHPTHPAVPPKPTGPTAVIDTSMGRLTCRLYATQAPELTANFIALATASLATCTTGPAPPSSSVASPSSASQGRCLFQADSSKLKS